MIAGIVKKQYRAILLVVFLMCGVGIYSALRIPAGLFPSTDFPRVVIMIDNGVLPADQMAATVTRPIEEAMSGVLKIQRIRSTTTRGSCEINLFFDWGADMDLELQLVQARLSQVALPPTATITRLERLTFAAFPVIGYSLTSTTLDPSRLRQLADRTLQPRLSRLPGVARVKVDGGKQREYQLVLDNTALDASGLSSAQVVDAVRNANAVSSPGLISENHQLEMVLVSGLVLDPRRLLDISVAVVNGQSVKVGDIASLRVGPAPDYTIVTADRKPAVIVNISRQPGANILAVTSKVQAELKTLRLPAGVELKPFYDQSGLVANSVASVRDAIILGLLLSVAILYAFLRDWATTLVAAVVIPIAILFTFCAIHAAGLSFDLLTLGGLAAAIGLVIDDAIVVVEDIHRHVAEGHPPGQAVNLALAEVTWPLIGSTLTPVVVFLPTLLLTGIAGVFFRSLAITLVVALLSSLLLALFLTPVLASLLLKKGAHTPDQRTQRPARFSPLIWLVRFYAATLRLALQVPTAVILLAISLFAASLLLGSRLPSEFLPGFDEGAFVLDYEAPPGTSLLETGQMLAQIETMLGETPEVESYSRRTGLQAGGGLSEPNIGDFLVRLKTSRNRTTGEVVSELRQQIATKLPALHVEFAGILVDLIGDLVSSPQPVEVLLYSENASQLKTAAEAVEQTISAIPGIVDTFDGIVVSGAALSFQVDPERAARLGTNVAEVTRQLTIAVQGEVASNILENGYLVPIRVRGPVPALGPLSKQSLENLPLRTAGNTVFRTAQVADVTVQEGLSQIQRDGLRQCLAVTARLDGLDLGSAISAIQSRLQSSPPNGIAVEYGGLYTEQRRSFRELALVLALAVTLIFLVLVVEFRSLAQPFAIVTGASLSLSGAILALWGTGKSVNVISLLGAIMVVGIVAKNGILLLDAVGHDAHDAPPGATLADALVQAGARRFRPVLMTTLAAVLGMLPLALALGPGSEMLQPMAVAVVGGLSVSMFFSLLVTPAFYLQLVGGRESKDDKPSQLPV